MTSVAALGLRSIMKPASREAELEYAFPDVDPNHVAVGHKIVVQLRRPKRKISSIHLADETIDAQNARVQVGKVISLGPVCFKKRDTLEPWPEKDWCKPGDYIRVPMYGSNTWFVDGPEATPDAVAVKFALIQDHEILGIVPDPLKLNKDML